MYILRCSLEEGDNTLKNTAKWNVYVTLKILFWNKKWEEQIKCWMILSSIVLCCCQQKAFFKVTDFYSVTPQPYPNIQCLQMTPCMSSCQHLLFCVWEHISISTNLTHICMHTLVHACSHTAMEAQTQQPTSNWDFMNLIYSGYNCALWGLLSIHLKPNQTKEYIP